MAFRISAFSRAVKHALVAFSLPIAISSCDDDVTSKDNVINASTPTNNLPVYRASEVALHKTKQTGIWVTYKDGVYDITKFIPNHPGGQEKIKLAAGSSIDSYWNIYRQHFNSKLPLQILESLRIGNLHADDINANAKESLKLNATDPFNSDPTLPGILKVHSLKPINAEAPGFILTDSWITPSDAWFVRNHHPCPALKVDEQEYKIRITGIPTTDKSDDPNSKQQKTFTLHDLKNKFKKHTVISTLQCGGNRRDEMNRHGVTSGTPWGISAISTAVWSGVRLSDLLSAANVDICEEALENNRIYHVGFAAEEGMEASIPVKKACSRSGDVIVAYEMNGADIPQSHGYPLRVIVPGHVGVRNVKWLTKINLSSEEAKGPWQRSMAYKGFGPSVKSIENIDVENITSLQEQPVQSCITMPYNNKLLLAGTTETIKGYAYSGGGRGIVRVDVSADGGDTWQTATLGAGSEQSQDRAWAWTFWECDVQVPKEGKKKIEVICKATDASYNVQPDSIKGIWNLRGINNNAWHRVNCPIVEDDDDDDKEDNNDD